jgi:golgin subfamily B member 1
MVYRALGLNEELASLYERKVTRATNLRDRSQARLDHARVLEEKVGDAARARKVVEAQIAEDPSDADALAELERLAGKSNGWKDAVLALSSALDASKDVPSGTRSELWIKVAGWQKTHLSDLRAAEDSFGHALAGDPENADILRSIEELQRAPGRERDLVATLRARARLESSLTDKRNVLEEAKVLAETIVNDRALAEAVLRDLLAEEDTNAWALEELGKLREAAGDFAEVVKLLLRRAELADVPEQQITLKHRAAVLAGSELSDTPRAIELYEQILEQDPNDEDAAARLRTLYAAAGKQKELGKLLELLIDNAKSAEARSTLRLDLAKLQEERFKAPQDAIDTLRAILDEDPTQAQAVLALSELYEKTGKDEELAELLDAQIKHAKERSDAAAELTLTVRLGEVYEGRLKDAARALETYEAVLARDPAHRGALEAVARLAEGRSAWERAAKALLDLLAQSTGDEGVAVALRLAAARGKLDDGPGVEDALRRALEIDAKNQDVRARLRDLYEKGKKWAELADMLLGDANLIAAEHPEVAPPPASPPSERPAPAASIPPPAAATVDVVRLLRRAAEIHVTLRKEPADAVPLLERASSLVPSDRELLMLLVDAYTAAKRERDAAQVLEKVIASYGNRRVKELSVYHHRLGKALAQLGDKDVALAQFDMAFKIDPGSISVLKDLGVLALEANDLERAQKTFKALLLQGQRLDANAGISKGEVFYYLGEISAKQGDKTRAVEMLKRAIENEPGLDRAKAMLTELKG